MRAELLAALLFWTSADAAQAQTVAPPIDRIDRAVAEAAQRFELPESWIRAVIRSESGADPRAVSPKGAIGLMQLMPETWAALRAELDLGSDPFDVHDNVVAGAAYLRRLFDQFGPEGSFAAYNAGPRRYLDYIAGGRPLPNETRAYVAAVRSALGGPIAQKPPVRGAGPDVSPSVFARLDTAFPAPSGDAPGLFVVTLGR